MGTLKSRENNFNEKRYLSEEGWDDTQRCVCARALLMLLLRTLKVAEKVIKMIKWLYPGGGGHNKTPLTPIVDETFLQEHNLSNLTNENCLEIKIRDGEKVYELCLRCRSEAFWGKRGCCFRLQGQQVVTQKRAWRVHPRVIMTNLGCQSRDAYAYGHEHERPSLLTV